MSPIKEKDFLVFQGVLGAVLKGVPWAEAADAISGSPDEWNAVVDRMLVSFGDLEVES